jgi:RNA polymerase sigma-70 factor (sigma-E family)
MPRSDPRAGFEEFVAARRPRLRGLAFAMCGDWHAAEDLVQIALAKLYVVWPKVERKGAEEAYCRRIIATTRIDESRRPWRGEKPGLEGFDTAARATDPTDRPALVTALQLLPAMQRKVVVLRHWWGLSVTETADELGISEGTVKSHSSRGLARLQQLLDETHPATEPADTNGGHR